MSRVALQSFPSPPSNRHLMARSFIVKTNRPHLYESAVLVSTTRPLTTPSKIRPSSNQFLKIQRRLSRLLSASFNNNTANHIHGPSVPDDNSQRGTFWPNERRRFKGVDPSFPVLILLSDLCSTSWLAVACPNHFAPGDVYALLEILRSAPVDAILILIIQDLAGFFTSIDQERFIGAWFMLLDFLRSKVFSVYPGKSNSPGDIIKGRTFRRLNVTRKITIKDVPGLLTTALNMQTFALGQRCIRQCRGSPMGSPLSPALCLMVVSISEQS